MIDFVLLLLDVAIMAYFYFGRPVSAFYSGFGLGVWFLGFIDDIIRLVLA